MKAELKQRLNDYMKVNNVSQEAAAKSIGISGGALSAWRKDKYNGDNAKLDGMVSDYLSRNESVSEEITAIAKDFPFVETTVFEDIKRGVELADLRGEIRAVVGASGVGKTTALKHLSEKRTNMIFVQAYRGIRKNRFLKKLCKAANVSSKGSFDDMFEELSERLEGSNKLIVIDEAEHLPIDAIDALRRINDFTGCGVVICGLPILLSMLQQHQDVYSYIYNRLAMNIVLKNLTTNDVEKLVSTCIKSDVPSGVWADVCHGVGRDLKFIVFETKRISRLNGISINTKLVNTVKKELGRIYQS